MCDLNPGRALSPRSGQAPRAAAYPLRRRGCAGGRVLHYKGPNWGVAGVHSGLRKKSRPDQAAFFNLSGFLTWPAWVPAGGRGMMPACPSSLATVSDGCAPTASQYLRQRGRAGAVGGRRVSLPPTHPPRTPSPTTTHTKAVAGGRVPAGAGLRAVGPLTLSARCLSLGVCCHLGLRGQGARGCLSAPPAIAAGGGGKGGEGTTHLGRGRTSRAAPGAARPVDTERLPRISGRRAASAGRRGGRAGAVGDAASSQSGRAGGLAHLSPKPR